MKKKIVSALLLCSTALSLMGCGNNPAAETSASATERVVAAETDTEVFTEAGTEAGAETISISAKKAADSAKTEETTEKTDSSAETENANMPEVKASLGKNHSKASQSDSLHGFYTDDNDVAYSKTTSPEAIEAYEGFLNDEELCYYEDWGGYFFFDEIVSYWFDSTDVATASDVDEFMEDGDVYYKYVYVDYNWDGEDELLLSFKGGYDGDGSYLLIQYTEDEGLIGVYDTPAGARWDIGVFESGVFANAGSDGASVTNCDWYLIDEDGDEIEIAGCYVDEDSEMTFDCAIDSDLSYEIYKDYDEDWDKEEVNVFYRHATRFIEDYCGMMLDWSEEFAFDFNEEFDY